MSYDEITRQSSPSTRMPTLFGRSNKSRQHFQRANNGLPSSRIQRT